MISYFCFQRGIGTNFEQVEKNVSWIKINQTLVRVAYSPYVNEIQKTEKFNIELENMIAKIKKK